MFIADDCIQEVFDLLADVYKLAIKDARRGNREALEFLEICCPDWRDLSIKYKEPKANERIIQSK